MESDARFAAVKSVTELLPSSVDAALAKHVRVMRLEKATDSRRNIFLCKYYHFKLSLSFTQLTHHVALYVNLQSVYSTMKLDTRALRYLTADDWRVLAAVCPQHLGGLSRTFRLTQAKALNRSSKAARTMKSSLHRSSNSSRVNVVEVLFTETSQPSPRMA